MQNSQRIIPQEGINVRNKKKALHSIMQVTLQLEKNFIIEI